jgi:hypothetical protein
MIRKLIRVGALLVAGALFICGAAPASARALPVTVAQSAVSLSSQLDLGLGVAPDPCVDSAYRLIGPKQAGGTYDWSFNAASVPGYLSRRAVKNTIIRSFHNITSEHNDCGRAARISASANSLGKTARKPKCNAPDGYNVVGFGRLPRGVLAVTCFWTRGGKIVEADMMINNRESWALSLRHCNSQVMLEATVTHEAGHVFGLDHVGERRHGRLTMSPYIDGLCENNEATLGLGDMLGLEALY